MKANQTTSNIASGNLKRALRNRELLWAAFALVMLLFTTIVSAAPAKKGLSLSDYLEQVGEKNQSYLAAQQSAKAAKLTAGEATLIYKPVLDADGRMTADGFHNPFEENKDALNSRSASIGVSEQTKFGLNGKLSYVYSYYYAPFTLGQRFDPATLGYQTFQQVPAGSATWADGHAKLDLSLALWRNFWGSETRAQSELAESSALAKVYSQSFATKAVLLEAESSYWRLALARELVAMQKDAVDRAQKIQDWTSRRVNLQLTDRSEALAASTNLQARRLDLRNAQDDERAAAQAFNSARGVLSDTVTERLTDLGAELVARMSAPERSLHREDLKASEYQARASAAAAKISREKNKPTFELYASKPLTGIEAIQSGMQAYVAPTDRPSTTVGVRMSMPLDVMTESKVREGYAAEALAADWTYQRKVFDEELDWINLSAKFREAKDRFKLYADLEKTQKEKLEFERERQQRGRSTLNQVLLFESDLQLAQLGRIRTLTELLTLNAQMKLYGVSYESR